MCHNFEVFKIYSNNYPFLRSNTPITLTSKQPAFIIIISYHLLIYNLLLLINANKSIVLKPDFFIPPLYIIICVIVTIVICKVGDYNLKINTIVNKFQYTVANIILIPINRIGWLKNKSLVFY